MSTNFVSSVSGISLMKIDYSDIPEVLRNLKKDWPHSIHTYYFLLNFMNWTKERWDGEFDVYRPNISGSIGSVMAVAKFKDGYTFVHYHCIDKVSCKHLHDGIRNTNVLNWRKLLIFEAIHDRLVPGLQEIIEEKGLKVVKNDKCLQVWMPPAQAHSVSVKLPPELYSQPLQDNQTKLINKNWGYTGPATEIIVRDSLALNGGLGLRLRTNNSLVGWSVEQHYGGIGMLFIQPEFRRKGYAAALVKTMIRRAVDRGIDPFAIIEVSNDKSRQLFQKLQFENICMVHWIGVQKV